MSTTAVNVEESRVHYVPLLVEIKPETCEDESKERHEDGDSNRTAVGGAVGFRVSECNVLPDAQTWKTEHRTLNQRMCKTESMLDICCKKNKKEQKKIETQNNRMIHICWR